MALNQSFEALPSPCYVVDTRLLRQNLELLRSVKERTGCKILLAQKAFSLFRLYPMIGEYLDGAAASGLFEARLAREEMPGENHVYSPAFRGEDMGELTRICDHIVFNSFAQWEKYGGAALAAGAVCGLRINPERSTQNHAVYDPCTPGSRLGVTASTCPPELPEGITGLHFHTLCEQNSDALSATLEAVEEKFGAYLGGLEWINFGGGHHITRNDYDVERLIREILRIRDKYGLQVYLEPGEAVVLNTGFLASTVLDTLQNGMDLAILDTSAACHMPDVLEVPYRPEVIGGGQPGEKPYTYRIGGPTCLAGDLIGDYSFDAPLEPGNRVVFCDMALYTMVKNNTFNGMPLPAIAVFDEAGQPQVLKEFGYEDFKNRLS